MAVDKNAKQIKGTKIVRDGYVSQAFEYASSPTDFQKQEQEQCFGCGRKLFNEYVDGLYTYLESTGYAGGKISYVVPSYTEITNKYDFMKARLHDSKVYANVKKNFENALKKYNEDFAWKEKREYKKSAVRRAKNTDYELSFRDLKGLPKFHSKKKGKFSYTTNNYKDPKSKYVLYIEEILNEKTKKVEYFLRLPKIGMLKINMHRPLPEGYIINNVTLKREYDQYMVSINVDFPLDVQPIKVIKESQIGTFDYSQKDFYVDHNGNKANPPKYYRKNEKKLKRLQRRYSRSQENEDKTLSKNKQKALEKLQKLSTKVTRQRKHWLHTLSHQKANEFECVGFEDINLRNMAQTFKLAKNLHDHGFGNFRVYAQYKMERQGKLFIKVDKFFPSSKRCCKCHHVKKELKLSERTYECFECGNIMDRDHNAAENLKQEVIRILTQEMNIQVISA